MSGEVKKIDVSNYDEVEAEMLAKAGELSRTLFGNDKAVPIIMEFASYIVWLGKEYQAAQKV